MPTILLVSIVSITAALFAYIIVRIMNKRKGTFTWAQFIVLLIGLGADLLGTAMMKMLAEGWRFDLHSILGYSALLLMLGFTAYGLLALTSKNQERLDKFGKYYFPALIVWVLSYATGVVLGIEKISERTMAAVS